MNKKLHALILSLLALFGMGAGVVFAAAPAAAAVQYCGNINNSSGMVIFRGCVTKNYGSSQLWTIGSVQNWNPGSGNVEIGWDVRDTTYIYPDGYTVSAFDQVLQDGESDVRNSVRTNQPTSSTMKIRAWGEAWNYCFTLYITASGQTSGSYTVGACP